MSAETLRRAARAARDEWAGETTGPFKNAARIHLAVADLLETLATLHEFQMTQVNDFGDEPIMHSEIRRALAVARAYLGEQA